MISNSESQTYEIKTALNGWILEHGEYFQDGEFKNYRRNHRVFTEWNDLVSYIKDNPISNTSFN